MAEQLGFQGLTLRLRQVLNLGTQVTWNILDGGQYVSYANSTRGSPNPSLKLVDCKAQLTATGASYEATTLGGVTVRRSAATRSIFFQGSLRTNFERRIVLAQSAMVPCIQTC